MTRRPSAGEAASGSSGPSSARCGPRWCCCSCSPWRRSPARWCRSARSPRSGSTTSYRASGAGSDLRQDRDVRGLFLAVVLRDLPAAVPLADRLHHPPGPGVRRRIPGRAARDPAEPVPAAGVRAARVRRRAGRPAGRRAGRRRGPPGSRRGRAEEGPLPGGPSRRRFRLGGARLSPGGGQPGVPHQPARAAARSGDQRALRLPRRQRRGGRSGLLQHLDPVRRPDGRRRLPRAGVAAVHRAAEELRGEVRDRPRPARSRPAVPGRRRGHRRCRCGLRRPRRSR